MGLPQPLNDTYHHPSAPSRPAHDDSPKRLRGRNGNSLNCLANEGGSGLPHSIASAVATSKGSGRHTRERRNGNSLDSVSSSLAEVYAIQLRAICAEAVVREEHGRGALLDIYGMSRAALLPLSFCTGCGSKDVRRGAQCLATHVFLDRNVQYHILCSG